MQKLVRQLCENPFYPLSPSSSHLSPCFLCSNIPISSWQPVISICQTSSVCLSTLQTLCFHYNGNPPAFGVESGRALNGGVVMVSQKGSVRWWKVWKQPSFSTNISGVTQISIDFHGSVPAPSPSPTLEIRPCPRTESAAGQQEWAMDSASCSNSPFHFLPLKYGASFLPSIP